MGGSMSIVLQSAGGGSVTFQEPSTATNWIHTLPAQQGTLALTSQLGVTAADQWRITTDKGSITSTTIFDANWERVDTDGGGSLGTGLTESSGIFTFPSTGYWLIQAQVYYRATGGANAFFEAYMQTTTDNSTYDQASIIITGGQASNDYGGLYGSFIFNVTSTTTHKFRLGAASSISATATGSTAATYTGLTFIRLGA